MKSAKKPARIQTVHKYTGDLSSFLASYAYLPVLTSKLDDLSGSFTQEILNEIVLWKVSRYAQFDQSLVADLNTLEAIDPALLNDADRCAVVKDVLGRLLDLDWVDLPMASTILRFRNPRMFQIIDRRSYRVLTGKGLRLYSMASRQKDPNKRERQIEKRVKLYCKYLAELRQLASTRGLDFKNIDRVLYQFDVQTNPEVTLGAPIEKP